MAGFSPGAAFAQGNAAGFQGQQLSLDSVIRQLQARAAENELQQRQQAQEGSSTFGKAIMDLFGGQPPQAMPPGPAPGQASVPMAQPGQQPPVAAPAAPMTGEQAGAPPQAAPPLQAAPAAAVAPRAPMLPGTGGNPALTVMQGGQPQLTWGNVVQAIRRQAPDAPPGMLAAAVDKFVPLMDHAQKNHWEQIKFGMGLYEKRLEWEERARQADERSKDRAASLEERQQWHEDSVAARREATAASAQWHALGQQNQVIVAQLMADARERNNVRTNTTRVDTANQADQRGRDIAQMRARNQLTPEQKLLDDKRARLTSQLNAMEGGGAGNSQRAKTVRGEIATLEQQLAETLQQAGPTLPSTRPIAPPAVPAARQPTPTTAPLPPVGFPTGLKDPKGLPDGTVAKGADGKPVAVVKGGAWTPP